MDHSKYTIMIDGRWSLEDLYIFPHAYEQVYFALEALSQVDQRRVDERIQLAFQAFPWRGGYSAVAFYNHLKWATPKRYRPEIKAINYSSPGFIDLLLNLPEAVKVALVISTVAKALRDVNKLYHDIYTGLQERKLLRIKVESRQLGLAKDYSNFVQKNSKKMGEILGLTSTKNLNELTHDELVSLKILLSVFRRVRTLAEYVEQGKADFNSQTLSSKRTRDPK